eukprot:TRINITY_DN9953_c0_g1_i2.p1 TRINITY_DN9953_c0_g1~~TRINITY_DN9953_c0_g1_i2.p1  ORF type:complete len:175 (-),score=24.15 TRINITY_DN9953_c0_g1_i2:567-1091(-)
MAQQGGRLCCGMTPARAKLLIWLLAAAVGVYILGPPLAHLISGTTAVRLDNPCAACECDCKRDVADCAGSHQGLQNDLYSRKVALLEEHLQLQEKVADESQQKVDSAFLDAKKLTSQYQKEAEKCNNGMETSEGARERAEAALATADKMVALWKRRALDLGWGTKSARDVMHLL